MKQAEYPDSKEFRAWTSMWSWNWQ